MPIQQLVILFIKKHMLPQQILLAYMHCKLEEEHPLLEPLARLLGVHHLFIWKLKWILMAVPTTLVQGLPN